jgi:predicted PurR-regulated permease PerM
MTQTHGLSMKRTIGYTAVVLATLALLLVVYRLSQVVLLFVLSVIMAAALTKGVVALENRRVPRGIAILVWYLIIVGVLGLGIYVLGGPLGRELQTIGEQFPLRYDAWLDRFQTSGIAWQQGLADRLPTVDAVLKGLGEGGAAEIGFQIAGLTTGIINVVVSLIAILTLTFYWLIDQGRFERLWLTLLPVQQRAIARHTWRGVEYRVGAYVRSEASQLVLTITILWFAFLLLGVTYPAMYALYAGVVQLIPWVGIPLTLLPLALMLLNTPWWLVLATGLVIVAVGIMMDRVVEPRLRGDAVVHPILIVLALMILGEAWGVLGMLIALPLAATIQIVLSELVRISVAPRALVVSAETTQIQELRARIERLREELPGAEDRRREAEGMLSRLETLLDRTEEIVQERGNADRAAASRTSRRRVAAVFQRTKTS